MLHKNLDLKKRIQWLKYAIKNKNLAIQTIKNIDYESAILPESLDRLKKLGKVEKFNKEFYSKLIEDLSCELSKKDLINHFTEILPKTQDFPFTFKYLIRDWGKDNKYNQLDIVVNYIKETIKQIDVNHNNKSLFIGCGNGKYAINLAEYYDTIDAFDNSLPMIWCIYYLKKISTWKIIHKTERNCRTVDDTISERVLEMSDEHKKIIDEKINFFVSDILSVDIKRNSINHLYSIYFTDVLPLKILFKKIDNWLMDNGLFIHFGPLDYFFTNENEMLTTQEIKAFFKKNRYEILVDNFYETRHLYIEESMKYQIYDNWFFVAKKTKEHLNSIDLNSILSLRNKVKLITTSSIENNQAIYNYSISSSEIEYNLPKFIFDLINDFDGVLNLKQILFRIDISLSDDDLSETISILNQLEKYKFILKND